MNKQINAHLKNETNEPSSYQSYVSDNATTPQDVTKDIENSILKEEFKENRSIIIEAIKQDIREKQYDDADQIFNKYQSVAQDDVAFNTLRKSLFQRISGTNSIEEIRTKYDIAESVKEKIQLCHQALQIDPQNAFFKKKLRQMDPDGTFGKSFSAIEMKDLADGFNNPYYSKATTDLDDDDAPFPQARLVSLIIYYLIYLISFIYLFPDLSFINIGLAAVPLIINVIFTFMRNRDGSDSSFYLKVFINITFIAIVIMFLNEHF